MRITIPITQEMRNGELRKEIHALKGKIDQAELFVIISARTKKRIDLLAIARSVRVYLSEVDWDKTGIDLPRIRIMNLDHCDSEDEEVRITIGTVSDFEDFIDDQLNTVREEVNQFLCEMDKERPE